MKNKGFTLIELLVVIAIIGLLTTLAIVALSSARAKSRDARRVSDIRQIQTAIELFFTSRSQTQYPWQVNATTGITLGSASFNCLDDDGFGTACSGNVYMGLVPTNPGPGGADYVYTAKENTVGACTDLGQICDSYQITFSLEGRVDQLNSGPHIANQLGIQ